VMRGDWHPIGCLRHRELSVRGEKINHHTFVVGIEVLDNNKCHSGLSWQGIKQLAAGIQPTSGRTNADHEETFAAKQRAAREVESQLRSGVGVNRENHTNLGHERHSNV
jgi:hypothetical protein